jgi:hypothetical protein
MSAQNICLKNAQISGDSAQSGHQRPFAADEVVGALPREAAQTKRVIRLTIMFDQLPFIVGG